MIIILIIIIVIMIMFIITSVVNLPGHCWLESVPKKHQQENMLISLISFILWSCLSQFETSCLLCGLRWGKSSRFWLCLSETRSAAAPGSAKLCATVHFLPLCRQLLQGGRELAWSFKFDQMVIDCEWLQIPFKSILPGMKIIKCFSAELLI